MPSQLATIADHIRYAFSRLNAESVYFGHGYDNPWDEAVQLVLQTLELPWDFDRDLWSCALTASERELVLERLHKRTEERVPLAYLTGQAWFCGMRFHVNSNVLVPRSPIAELIENHFTPWLNLEPQRVLDICTGSGCIGIALAEVYSEAHVDLVDISPEAISVAEQNIAEYRLEGRVVAHLSDGCEELLHQNVPPYQLIVANPPYVDAQDMADLPDEYHHEPRLGLEAGIDGLDLVHRLLREATKLLADGGLLVMEVGNSWPALEEAYPNVAFTWVEFERGGHGVFVMNANELRAMALND